MQDVFRQAVEHGFQASSSKQQGSIVASEAGTAGEFVESVTHQINLYSDRVISSISHALCSISSCRLQELPTLC